MTDVPTKSTLTKIYKESEEPSELAKQRLYEISDEYLVNITYFPNPEDPNKFKVEIKKYDDESAVVESDWDTLEGLKPYQQWVKVEEIVHVLLDKLGPELWEICGVDGCKEVSVGPCPNHQS